MRKAQLRSVRGYKRPRYRVGMLATTAPNRLQREFTVALPDQVWVTDFTYIRTYCRSSQCACFHDLCRTGISGEVHWHQRAERLFF